MRIVSLLPSTTEIVCDLGLADQLYGVTVECSWPDGVRRGREIVVTTFADSSMSPGQIDQVVRDRVREGRDLYQLDDEALQRARPDLILSQDLCRVCAVASGDVEAAMSRLNCAARVLQIDPTNLLEVIESIETIADATGVVERGATLVTSLRRRLDRVSDFVKNRVHPRVMVLEWVDPPFGAGHWVPDVIRAAGGVPVLAEPGKKSLPVSWEQIRVVAPDFVVVGPCGYGLDAAAEQARSVLAELPPSARVLAIDADAVLVRPGPRLIDGVESLAAALHSYGEVPDNVVREIGREPSNAN